MCVCVYFYESPCLCVRKLGWNKSEGKCVWKGCAPICVTGIVHVGLQVHVSDHILYAWQYTAYTRFCVCVLTYVFVHSHMTISVCVWVPRTSPLCSSLIIFITAIWMCRAHDECATQVWLAPNRILGYASSRQQGPRVADNAPCLSITHTHTHREHTLFKKFIRLWQWAFFSHSLFSSLSSIPYKFEVNLTFSESFSLQLICVSVCVCVCLTSWDEVPVLEVLYFLKESHVLLVILCQIMGQSIKWCFPLLQNAKRLLFVVCEVVKG